MNRILATMIFTATLSATFGVTALQAEQRAIATVPFAFHVQSQTMPAGRYEVSQVQNGMSMILISDRKGNSRFVGTVPEGNANPADSKLTFACYEDKCSLTALDLPGSAVSHKLQPSKPTVTMGLSQMIAVRLTH